ESNAARIAPAGALAAGAPTSACSLSICTRTSSPPASEDSNEGASRGAPGLLARGLRGQPFQDGAGPGPRARRGRGPGAYGLHGQRLEHRHPAGRHADRSVLREVGQAWRQDPRLLGKRTQPRLHGQRLSERFSPPLPGGRVTLTDDEIFELADSDEAN